MNKEQIELGLKMVAMGRLNHPALLDFVDALAVVLATPEERLAMAVQDEMPGSAVMVQVVTPETLPDEITKVLKPAKKGK